MDTVFSWNNTGLFLATACPAECFAHPIAKAMFIASLEPHKPKLAPRPYGLGKLFRCLQTPPDAPLSLAGWGTANLPHQGMTI